MPAIIKATSPLGIIPIPILVLCNKLNLNASAGNPEPNTFVRIATTEINNPATSAVWIELTSTSMPITTKNTGTKKFLIGSMLCSSFSFIWVVENANPAENAPIMNASPNISANPEHNNARPRTIGIFASTEPNLLRNFSIYFEVNSPMPVKATQKIMALAPIAPTDHISTLPDMLMPTMIDRIRIPSMSSITAAAIIVVPSDEVSLPISANTLAVIPTEVAVSIDPINKASKDHIPAGPAIPSSTLE